VRLFSLTDRYLIKQMLGIFALALLVFTLVAFFSDAFLDFLREVERYGLAPTKALALVVLQLPQAMALALPASLFLAVLLGYNSLNQHFELIALRVNGASLWQLVRPVVGLGVLVSFANLLLVNAVIPWANRKADVLKVTLIEQAVLPDNRSNVTLMDYDGEHRLKRLLYIGQTQQKAFSNVTLMDLSRPDVLQIVQASHGSLQGERWRFVNANAYTIGRDNNLLVFNHVGDLQKTNLLPKDTQLASLKERLNVYAHGFLRLRQVLKQRAIAGEEVVPKYFVRLWEKLTLPASCLLIALTGVPLAIVAPRRNNERGFVLAIGILFLFYVLRSLSVAVGQSGAFTFGGLLTLSHSIALATAMPLLLMLALALGLLWRKAKVL
jgi:lipopolysaccharide export system permease protein